MKKYVTLIATLALAVPAFCAVTINSASEWYDTSGNRILAQGGNILQVGNTYYWYGTCLDITNQKTFVYTSTNLGQWTFAGKCYNGSGRILRPKVIYNKTSGNYVMIAEGGPGIRNGIAYLTATNPLGPFVMQRTDRSVFGKGMGDHSIFQDTDGSAYLLATTDDINNVENGTETISKLTPDYLHLESPVAKFEQNANKREAPAMLKVGQTYYFFTSRCRGWASSKTEYWKATNLAGPWSPLTPLKTDPDSQNSFDTQHNADIAITGTEGTTYIYIGDRWSNRLHKGVGLHGWYPITFNHDIPTLHGPNTWVFDSVKGTWHSAN